MKELNFSSRNAGKILARLEASAEKRRRELDSGYPEYILKKLACSDECWIDEIPACWR